MKYSLGISNFLEKISSISHSIVSLFLSIDHWGRLSYLSLLFCGTVHSNGYIFPFLLCLSLLFYSQLFVRPPQTFCLFAFLFLGDGLNPCLLYNVTNLRPWDFPGKSTGVGCQYDQNQIPYDYTVEVRSRFKGTDLIDTVPDKLWTEVCDVIQETGIKTILMEKKCKKAKCLRRPYK